MKSLTSLIRALENGLNGFNNKVFEREAKKIGLKAVKEVKELTPVVTGTLRRRWRSSIKRRGGGDVEIEISNNTEYGAAVNYGHRIVRGGKTIKMTKGKYFLERGLENYKNSYLKNDINNMIEVMKREFK